MVGLAGAVFALVLSVTFYAGGEYFSKLWGNSTNLQFILAALALYLVSSLMWFPALLYRNQLSTIGIAWDVLAISATLFLGIVVFHEKLLPHQIVGIVLALIALVLLLR